jgi:hypothetical protein
VAIRGCSREIPTTWFVSAIEAYVQFEGQSDQSYMEQKLAVKIGICSFDKYLQQLGPRAMTQTKNVIIHGIPGSVPVHFVDAVGQWQATSSESPRPERIMSIFGVWVRTQNH